MNNLEVIIDHKYNQNSHTNAMANKSNSEAGYSHEKIKFPDYPHSQDRRIMENLSFVSMWES